MTDFGSLVIVGAVVSLLVQALKNHFGTNGTKTLAVVAGLSVLGGVLFHFVSSTSYFPAIMQILISAGAVYTFILQRFETPKA